MNCANGRDREPAVYVVERGAFGSTAAAARYDSPRRSGPAGTFGQSSVFVKTFFRQLRPHWQPLVTLFLFGRFGLKWLRVCYNVGMASATGPPVFRSNTAYTREASTRRKFCSEFRTLLRKVHSHSNQGVPCPFQRRNGRGRPHLFHLRGHSVPRKLIRHPWGEAANDVRNRTQRSCRTTPIYCSLTINPRCNCNCGRPIRTAQHFHAAQCPARGAVSTVLFFRRTIAGIAHT